MDIHNRIARLQQPYMVKDVIKIRDNETYGIGR